MKRLFSACLLFVIAGWLSSCTKTKAVKTNADLRVTFVNEVDGKPITFGGLNYTNAAGNNYSVDLLKYYISDFTLVESGRFGNQFSHARSY